MANIDKNIETLARAYFLTKFKLSVGKVIRAMDTPEVKEACFNMAKSKANIIINRLTLLFGHPDRYERYGTQFTWDFNKSRRVFLRLHDDDTVEIGLVQL